MQASFSIVFIMIPGVQNVNTVSEDNLKQKPVIETNEESELELKWSEGSVTNEWYRH